MICSKNTKQHWTDNQQKAFGELKSILTQDLSITHFDPKLDIILGRGTSDYVIGAVLIHKYDNESKNSIANALRSLLPAEQNYGQIEKEA